MNFDSHSGTWANLESAQKILDKKLSKNFCEITLARSGKRNKRVLLIRVDQIVSSEIDPIMNGESDKIALFYDNPRRMNRNEPFTPCFFKPLAA